MSLDLEHHFFDDTQTFSESVIPNVNVEKDQNKCLFFTAFQKAPINMCILVSIAYTSCFVLVWLLSENIVEKVGELPLGRYFFHLIWFLMTSRTGSY